MIGLRWATPTSPTVTPIGLGEAGKPVKACDNYAMGVALVGALPPFPDLGPVIEAMPALPPLSQIGSLLRRAALAARRASAERSRCKRAAHSTRG